MKTICRRISKNFKVPAIEANRIATLTHQWVSSWGQLNKPPLMPDHHYSLSNQLRRFMVWAILVEYWHLILWCLFELCASSTLSVSLKQVVTLTAVFATKPLDQARAHKVAPFASTAGITGLHTNAAVTKSETLRKPFHCGLMFDLRITEIQFWDSSCGHLLTRHSLNVV